MCREVGGETGIRTLGGVAPTTVFETAPFDRSGISPLAGTHRGSRSETQVDSTDRVSGWRGQERRLPVLRQPSDGDPALSPLPSLDGLGATAGGLRARPSRRRAGGRRRLSRRRPGAAGNGSVEAGPVRPVSCRPGTCTDLPARRRPGRRRCRPARCCRPIGRPARPGRCRWHRPFRCSSPPVIRPGRH